MKKLVAFSFLFLCLNSFICFAEKIDVFKLVEKATPESLDIMLKKGIDFNVQRSISDFDDDTELDIDYWPFDTGETPLHRAAAYNHNPESIKFLINHGLDVNARAYVGNYASISPLACAVSFKNIAAVEELLKAGANPNNWIEGGYNFVGTSFHIVAVDYDDETSVTREIITLLIKAGGNVNSYEKLSEETLKGLNKSEPDFAKHKTIFLSRNQWPDDEPFYNMTGFFAHYTMRHFLSTFTPLMWAVIYDKPNIADILLDFGADVNIRSVENKSAVDYANDLPESSKLKKSSVFKKLESLASH